LLSVNLPPGIKKGQQFTVLVRQVTSVQGRGAIVEAGPGKPALNATEAAAISWRRVLGTFQVNIPVSTKEILLPREEQRLSIFRWMAEAMPKQRRWYPVFQRYLEGIADKVQALGGDPTKILPSPTGEGRVKGPAHEERHEPLTGKVTGLLFDRFGDFEGFILETEYKEHKLLSREIGVERLADRAWREHLRITVWVDRDELHRPLSFMVHEPPATFGHDTRDE